MFLFVQRRLTSGKRNVQRIITSDRQKEGGGFVIRRLIGGNQLRNLDPFLMLDHMGPTSYGPGQAIGAPDHPHRGFETVTYVKQGSFEHIDSAGNSGYLGPGSVQWMTAGRGIVHSELPSKEILENGGVLEGFQLWVNLKAVDKMMSPRYQDIPSDEIPVLTLEDGLSTVKAICGSFANERSPIETLYPMFYFDVNLKPGGVFKKQYDCDFNSFIYIHDGLGCAEIAGTFVRNGDIAIIERCEVEKTALSSSDLEPSSLLEVINIDAANDISFLFGAGMRLQERVVQYGPFVMNTDDEIRQAIYDYQTGRLGSIDGAEERYLVTKRAREAGNARYELK